jgi:hypothetical protein
MRNALKAGWMTLALGLAASAAAESPWRAQATLKVSGPGLTEAVLPAGLHLRSDDNFDLALSDSKGQAVPLELYWREDAGASARLLEASSVTLDPAHGYQWEGSLPKDLQPQKLLIQAREGAAVGTVDVDVKRGGEWVRLASAAALTDDGQGPACSLKLNGGSAVRLRFQGFNEEFKKSVTPLAWVEVQGKPLKVDYVWRWTELKVATQRAGLYTLALPGVGLEAVHLRLRGQAPYLGSWSLSAVDARRGAWILAEGQTRGLAHKPLQLDIDLAGSLRARALKLSLDPRAAQAFDLAEASLQCRLPRLVFYAPAAGAYHLQSGLGRRVEALEAPNDAKREGAQMASFGPVETNAAWSPAAALAGLPLAGAAFHGDGYAWSAPVTVPAPGSYRLVLNAPAALDAHPAALRLVRGATQVPYVWAEDRQEDVVVLALEESYDAKSNESSYLLKLPQASPNWKALRIQTEGAFKRVVRLEQTKASGVGFEPWQQQRWIQGAAAMEPLVFDLGALRPQSTQLRLLISHGDNQRLPLQRAMATYDSPALLFVASEAGALELVGGNATVAAPDYDLSLFDELLGLEDPARAELGPLKPYAGQSLWQRLQGRLGQKQAGLYLVLGLVTLGLLILIVRILPKAEA